MGSVSPVEVPWNDDMTMVDSDGGEHFDSAFRVMWPAAFGLARRILGDVSEAEDAAAEGMARALVAWDRIRTLPHRDAWMLRVVSNVAIDRARRRSRTTVLLARHDVSPVGPDSDEVTVLRIALVEALASLPRRQREGIVLRHLCGLSEQEAAAAMGVSTNTVKKHTGRGIARLRDRLGPRIQEVDGAH